MSWLDAVLALIFILIVASLVGFAWAMMLAAALVAGVVGVLVFYLIRGKRL